MQKTNTIKMAYQDTCSVVIAFLVLFVSLGAIMHQQHYSFLQTFFSSALIAAAPLQIAIIQLHHNFTLSVIIVLSLAINFRCLLLSSALLPYLRNTKLRYLLLPAQGIAASTFAVVHPKLSEVPPKSPNTYFATVALVNYAAILIGTSIGFGIDTAIDSAFFKQMLVMILPINFTLLVLKRLPNFAPVAGASLCFILSPLANQYLGQYAILALPLLVAALLLVVSQRRSRT